jgi:hypothetical protein
MEEDMLIRHRYRLPREARSSQLAKEWHEMRKLTIPLVVVLALAIVLLLATTASAKKAEAPHFETHAVGTFDYVGDEYYPTYGVWWSPVVGDLVLVDGSIRVEVDIESVGDAFGPYNDGSEFTPKWDYETTGYLKVKFDVISPDGHPIRRSVKAEVDKVTVVPVGPYLETFYFFEGTYHGTPYSGYLGRGINDYHLYLPLLGQFLGGGDNYGIVFSDLGDFSHVLNDTLP